MNAIQFPFQFDIQLIAQELQTIAASFKPIHSLRIKENHLMGLHLILPNKDGEKDRNGFTFVSTSELDKCPYLQSILNTFPGNKLMYRVHNLKAQGKIELHRDTDRGLANGIVRIHIPITSNEEVYFYVNEERVMMQNGECWFADITQLHKVENRSNTDRLQLMIDCDLNDWWIKKLKEHGLELKKTSTWEKHSLDELQAMKENLSCRSSQANENLLKEINSEIDKKKSRLRI